MVEEVQLMQTPQVLYMVCWVACREAHDTVVLRLLILPTGQCAIVNSSPKVAYHSARADAASSSRTLVELTWLSSCIRSHGNR